MQKDVIYIDVDDDITAVIGKVKAAEHKIIALVPPARVSMLQSAVNLRLLKKAAEEQGKKLVIVSNNQQLGNLAGMSGIPVAKTLQSKPELAQIDALDVDGEDVIDGSSLSIGEHAVQAASGQDDDISDQMLAQVDQTITSAEAESPTKATGVKRSKKKKDNIPNFNKFRKRLFIFGALGVVLIGFLIWAIWFAPRAAITVDMQTNSESISQRVTLGESLTTSASANTIKAVVKQIDEDISGSADATGTKDVGEKATGTVTISNSSDSDSILVPAGTTVTSSSGKTYITNTAVTVPGATVSGGAILAGSASVGVTASKSGASYNAASGSASTSVGLPAEFTSATSGGTDKVVKVAKESDITSARESAQNSIDKDALAKQVVADLNGDYVIITDSVTIDTSDLKSDVTAGNEASSGKVTVSGKVTATVYAVQKTELEAYLNDVLDSKLTSADTQRVYDTGVNDASFTNVDKADKGISAGLSATGSIGPLLTDEQIKTIAAGKRYGEVQSELKEIQGVKSVSIDFSTFWVRTVPKDHDKITVEFKVDDQN